MTGSTDERAGALTYGTSWLLRSIPIWSFGAALACAASPAVAKAPGIWPAGLQDACHRAEALKAFAVGISRNDAEAIDVGWRGRKGWSEAVGRAEAEARTASSPQAFGIVLRRLYANYPSLHSHMELRADIDYRTAFGAPFLPFTMTAEVIGPGIMPGAVFISSVDTQRGGPPGAGLAVGDQVISINGRPLAYWLSEVEAVCRRNSRWQCYDDFDKQLRSGLLGWDPRSAMRIAFLRGGKQRSFTYVPRAAPTLTGQDARTGCAEDGTSYTGFERIYAGWNVCAFRSAAKPGVEIWRLKSFHYAVNATVDSPKSEVARFWNQHWRVAAPSVKTLIIDVSGNGGGDVPLAWYSLIFDRPYQEQYAQYLRLRAYDDPAIASEVPDDPAHEKWLAGVKRTNAPAWARVGGYLPPVPMFCADDDVNCEGKLVEPEASGFRGAVSLLIDDNCVSSCSGFSWNILDKLGRRAAAFGLPDSGDTNFRRLPIKLFYRHGRWATSLGTRSAPQEKPIATANVMVTRTTTSAGHVISGKSLPVREIIPRRWNDTGRSWDDRTLGAALSARK